MDQKDELFLYGESLREAIKNAHEKRQFLVDELIPEHSVTMLYAADGLGKSTLLLQIGLEASEGKAVFGQLATSKRLKVIYVMAERNRLEALERISLMADENDGLENFSLTDRLQGHNLLMGNEMKAFQETLCTQADRMGGVDLICIDPIYALIPRGLSTEEGASAVGVLNRGLQSRLGCSIAYVHHANRGHRNKETGQREALDMFGGRLLSANCTGVFHIRKADNGTVWEQQKDSYGCLAKSLKLDYDRGTYRSSLEDSSDKQTKTERMEKLFQEYHRTGATFTIDLLCNLLCATGQWIRLQVSQQVKLGRIVNLSPSGKKGCYKVLH